MLETIFSILLWLQSEEVDEPQEQAAEVVQDYSHGGGCPGGVCDSGSKDKDG